MIKNNMIGWIEIPVLDMQRAIAFYEAVFLIKIQLHDLGKVQMGWFPSDDTKTGASGALVYNPEWYIPNFKEGVLVYMHCEDVNDQLSSVIANGGRILKEKTKISDEVGYMGLIHDSEGNRIGLHSKN